MTKLRSYIIHILNITIYKLDKIRNYLVDVNVDILLKKLDNQQALPTHIIRSFK